MTSLGAMLGAALLQLLNPLHPVHSPPRGCAALSCYDCNVPNCGKTMQCTAAQKHCMEVNMTWRNGKSTYTQTCTPFGNFCALETKLAERGGSTGLQCRICSSELCNGAMGGPSDPPPPTALLIMAAAAVCTNALRK